MKPVQIPSFMSIGTTGIELREFKEKKTKDKIGKIFIIVLMKRKWYYSCFDMFYVLKSSEVETESKN